MNKIEEEKIKKEVKQIGLDIFIIGIILSMILGMCVGIFIAP